MLNFNNLTSEMAVRILDDKKLMMEFCALIKNVYNENQTLSKDSSGLKIRIAKLEKSNKLLSEFALSFLDKEEKKKNERKKRKPQPRKPRKQVADDFGWDDNDSFGDF